MKSIVSIAAACLFMLATVATAGACDMHGTSRTAEISKPVTTAETPVVAPKPATGG